MKLIVPTHGEFSVFGEQFDKFRQKAQRVDPHGRWGAFDHIDVVENEEANKPQLIDYKGDILAEGHDIFGHLKKMARQISASRAIIAAR